MAGTEMAMNKDRKAQEAKNIRTALVFLSIAVVFFVGVFAARMLGSDWGGLTVLGLAIIVFLVVAIVRNVKSRE